MSDTAQGEILNRRARILEALSLAAEVFLKATPDVWEEKVVEVLEHLGKARQSGRAYLCKNYERDGKDGVILRYEWKETGERRIFPDEGFELVYYEGTALARWVGTMRVGGVLCENVGQLKSGERGWNISLAAKTVVVIPVFIGEEWWGYLGFEDFVSEAECSKPEMEALKTVALLFGEAIKRKRIEEELAEEKQNVEERVKERTRELEAAQGSLEQALIQQKQERAGLTASIHSLSLGFVMTDVAGKVMLFNHAVNDILGKIEVAWDMEKLQEKLAGKVQLLETIEASIEQGREIEIPEIVYGEKFIKLNFTPIKMVEDDGRVIGVVMLITDITEAKRLEKSRDEFFAVASHELRTPLSAIRTNAAMLLDYFPEVKANNELAGSVTDMYDSSVRLIEIVNEYLEASRAEMSRIELRREELDVVALLRAVMDELGAKAKEQGLEWELQGEKGQEVMIFADTLRTRQILTNLLGNALKFTKAGGVYVKVFIEGEWGVVRIYDTGEGIGEEDRWQLFSKFRQAGDRVYERDASQGTGIGLYITRLLAEAMGGQVELETTKIGEGSTFVVRLPLVNNNQ
jgi:signal transduction histidine kinase